LRVLVEKWGKAESHAVIFNHALNCQLRREFQPNALNGGTVIFFFA
jgi:hypothetical protein